MLLCSLFYMFDQVLSFRRAPKSRASWLRHALQIALITLIVLLLVLVKIIPEIFDETRHFIRFQRVHARCRFIKEE